VGVILFLDRNGIVDGHVALSYWPLALLACGIYALASRCCSWVTGVILTVMGAALSLRPLGLVHLGFRELWPLALILLGLLMLWGGIQSRGHTSPWFRGVPGHTADIGDSDLDERAVFGGGERTIATNDFRGGRLEAVFSGWEIDLTHAVMQREQAVIEVRCVFGGVNLRVPDTWDVKLRVGAVLGGISDKTRHPRGEDLARAKRLIITGSAVFSGIEIKN
jgi:predicted membrane protein